MGIAEYIAGGVLLAVCVAIIAVVSVQSNKGSGMSGVIMGGEGTAARGRAKEHDAKLANITRILAVVLFVVTFAVTFIAQAANK